MKQVLVFVEPPAESPGLEDLLARQGYHSVRTEDTAEAVAWVRGGTASLVVIVRPKGEAGGWTEGVAPVVEAASRRGVPTFGVVEPSVGTAALGSLDDWASPAATLQEIAVRIERLIQGPRRGSTAGFTCPPRAIEVVLHDLRSPLNLIALSLQVIRQSVAAIGPDLDADLRYIEGNVRQMEQMLAQISDYQRLQSGVVPLEPTTFSPERLAAEVIEVRPARPWLPASVVDLEVCEGCPAMVTLDRQRARVGLHYALMNAEAAANGSLLLVILRGEGGRWSAALEVEHPPTATFQAGPLDPVTFEHLCGSPNHRRGMDLAISAKVSESFGGSARLDRNERGGTTITLDWPAALPTD